MRNFIIFILLFALNFTLISKDLSNGYKDIKLGMTKNQVIDTIKKSSEFRQKNDEVLSIRLEPDTEILTYEGLGYISVGYFHFNKDKLFQIFLKFNENKLGYYLLLKDNTDKFGKPSKLDPKSAVWQNKEVMIVIEKPCTIKYLYLPIWNELVKSDQTPDDIILKSRNDFVKDL
jgi:hypothetical protein